ncbi:hypothetical protein HanHA300_Chr02g0043421 [Helianthus annuus]|nr:hypothetical protein HanHA300_Chr02g0043421 [Helianthus annuus]KAJ0617891.1 hypothetical protein HanHA89_Chr02g0046871 [Helianthus annuus]
MSTGYHLDDSSEEMSSSLPQQKWSKEIFDGLVQNFKFPTSWGVMYPEEGQTAAQAPAGYITLFWDYFTEGNFRLPVTRFVLDILGYYKFHISQLNPMGMVRIRHFKFLCRSIHIELTESFSSVLSTSLFTRLLFVCSTFISQEDFIVTSQVLS